MLVRLGSPDSVPAGLRIVRARRAPVRAVLAVPSTAQDRGSERQERAYEAPWDATPWRALGEPVELVSAHERLAQRAVAAYRAADPVQPRPGLIVRVRA
jgi:hypothetical protein